jgi:hypothetical protein
MSDPFAGVISPLISILVSVVTLSAFMFKIGQWINKRADDKAVGLKKATEDIAINIKKNMEERAVELSRTAKEVATLVKVEAEERDDKLRDYTETGFSDNAKLISDLGGRLTDLDVKVTERIDKLDLKLMTMINDLGKRSDMVNGNIANIRTDIADLQEDLAEMNIANEDPNNVKTRVRAQRLKRRRIEADRISQSERKTY